MESHLQGQLGQGEAGQVGGGLGEVRHDRLPRAAVQGRGGGLQNRHLEYLVDQMYKLIMKVY